MRRVISILFILILFFAFAPKIKAANGSLYLSPSSGAYTVGNTFSIEVRVNTGGISINAAQGTFVFSPDNLSVVSVSKSGSIFSLWTAEPTYSNSSGTISFEGGVPNPGYTGASGKIITITFRARVNGTTQVNWSSGAILANDGKGTNILSSMSGGNYTLGASVIMPPAAPTEPSAPIGTPAMPEISSSTHPDENKWYKNSTVKFSWLLPEDITGVSIAFTQKSTSNPGSISDGIFDSKTYENTADGVWYLHLKFKNSSGWGPIGRFKVQIDTVSPKPFTVEIKEGKETNNPQPTLIFETTDETSGIDHYQVRIDGSEPLIVEINEVPYKLPVQSPGKHTIVVEAFDKAGNNTAAVAEVSILAIEAPKITEYPKRLSVEENLVIKGTALPKSTIKINIQKEGVGPMVGQTQTDENGNWLYAHDKFLSKGVYKIYAVAINDKLAQSYPSQEITVLVALPPLFIIGGVIIDYMTVIIVLLALIGLIIFGSYWARHRFMIFKQKLIKETEDINRVMKRAFELLNQEVEDQLNKLNKVRNKRELSKEEKDIQEQLKRDINVAEKYIRREVEDVERKLTPSKFNVKNLFKKNKKK